MINLTDPLALEDPALAWALIERLANATLPQEWRLVLATLDEMRGRCKETELPDEHAANLLRVALARLSVHVGQYLSGCETVWGLMREHRRRWPKWEGPTP